MTLRSRRHFSVCPRSGLGSALAAARRRPVLRLLPTRAPGRPPWRRRRARPACGYVRRPGAGDADRATPFSAASLRTSGVTYPASPSSPPWPAPPARPVGTRREPTPVPRPGPAAPATPGPAVPGLLGRGRLGGGGLGRGRLGGHGGLLRGGLLGRGRLSCAARRPARRRPAAPITASSAPTSTVSSSGDLDLQQRAGDRRRDLGVDLVGGDLEQRLVDLHRVADLLEPAGDGALGDALAERRHRHRCRPPPPDAGAGAARLRCGGLGSPSAGCGSAARRPAGLRRRVRRPAPPRCSSARLVGAAARRGAASPAPRVLALPPMTAELGADLGGLVLADHDLRAARRRPGDGISVSTLSVETSSRGSSTSTRSPSCLSQRVTVPSVTLSPSRGHGDRYRHLTRSWSPSAGAGWSGVGVQRLAGQRQVRLAQRLVLGRVGVDQRATSSG